MQCHDVVPKLREIKQYRVIVVALLLFLVLTWPRAIGCAVDVNKKLLR
jgi:hypothetical protein